MASSSRVAKDSTLARDSKRVNVGLHAILLGFGDGVGFGLRTPHGGCWTLDADMDMDMDMMLCSALLCYSH